MKLHSVILDGLDKQTHISKENPQCRMRGRPTKKIKLDDESTLSPINTKLWKQTNKDQRSDAEFATCIRFIKNIPRLLLGDKGSKNRFKSKDICSVTEEYTRIYTCLFMELLTIDDETLRAYQVNNYEMFLHYTLLCFPERRCSRILDILRKAQDQSILREEKYQDLIDQLKMRKIWTVSSFTKFYFRNKFFKLIIDRAESKIQFPSKMMNSLVKLKESIRKRSAT